MMRVKPIQNDAAQTLVGSGVMLPGTARFGFELLATDPASAARAGRVLTSRGLVETPGFMPVGTNATVKAMTGEELREIGVEMVLANAYHLYLRPGVEIIARAGGLHGFMNWPGPILTDSGGYQVFSLAALNRVDEDGVDFRSHLDGSRHRFTPEGVVDLQGALGSDIVMPLDHCLANPATHAEAHAAARRTLQWLERSVARMRTLEGRTATRPQALFGIVQGSTFADLRRDSARATTQLDLLGTAIGGLAVGEPREEMYGVLEALQPELHPDRPRYLMGVGFPQDLLASIARGMDLFDCVAPTRHGRNGALFTAEGRINIRNTVFATDYGPLDPTCACRACASSSRAYLHHLFHAREILGLRLATYHNLSFLTELLRAARQAIFDARFASWSASFLDRYTAGR
jgi:queuine tRNA-ribosyltransferase